MTNLLILQTLNGLQFGILLFLVAAGLTLVFGVMDVINLAHGAQYMLGAYLAAAFTALTGSFALGLLAALPVALAFGLLAVPLARTTPRQARRGGMVIGVLGYLVGMSLAQMGERWIASGRIVPELGLWWLTLPLLALAAWMYLADGALRRPRRPRRAEATP